MPKYLFIASYTSEGTKGLLAGGGTKRRDEIARLAESVGGTMESFYFAFGEGDAYVTCELPDASTAAALSMAVNAAAAAAVRTVVLLDPEELDRAARMTVSYKAPG